MNGAEMYEVLRKHFGMPEGTPAQAIVDLASARMDARDARAEAAKVRAAVHRPAPAPARSQKVTMASRFDSRTQVEVDVFGRNPLADDYCQVSPRMAAKRSSAPTLFASGDLPPYTASGHDPRALLNLPWNLRHAAAKADQAGWARIFDEAAEDGGFYAQMFLPEISNDPGNGEYETRVREWARKG